jgi:hypothetical protein
MGLRKLATLMFLIYLFIYLCKIQNNNTAAVRTFSSSFGLMAIGARHVQEVLTFVDRFTATGAPPGARSIRIVPMSHYA